MIEYQTDELEVCSVLASFIRSNPNVVMIIIDDESGIYASTYPGELCNPFHEDYDLLEDKVILEVNHKSNLLDIEAMVHELKHIEQILCGTLVVDNGGVLWKGVKYNHIHPKGCISHIKYFLSPWEIEAYKAQYNAVQRILPWWLWFPTYILYHL
jgi:hypothetical protein